MGRPCRAVTQPNTIQEGKLMTATQRLQLEQLDLQRKLNELLGVEALTDEQRVEMATLTARLEPVRYRTKGRDPGRGRRRTAGVRYER